tara:strand:- start:78 stop:350 length:273 start_codon:yes stop_codon:yes gene_type:complete
MYLISVSKAYSNYSGRASTRRKPKNLRFAYFLDENEKMYRRKLSKFEYFIFKYLKTKYKKNKFCCEKCGNTFSGIIKKHKHQIECPYCLE